MQQATEAFAYDNDAIQGFNVLNDSMDKLRQEHYQLKHELMEFYGMAKVLGQDDHVINWSGSIDNLRRKIIAFMSELDIHSEWEDQVLFPYVQQFAGRDIADLVAMEEEHEEAKRSVSSFLQATESFAAPVCCEEARKAAACLLQAYTVLTDHFRKEEEVLFPLAEELLGHGRQLPS